MDTTQQDTTQQDTTQQDTTQQDTTQQDTAAARFAAADRPLTAVLDAAPPGGWGEPSPCEGWSARDVVAHLVDTQRDFLTGHGVDLGPRPDVGADPAAAWRAHAGRVAAALADDAVPATGFDGWFGPTTVGATLVQFYVWDMLVHRWDVARALGGDATLSDAELDRIASGADGFGEALYMDGICRPSVDAPTGSGRQAGVLARLGRDAS